MEDKWVGGTSGWKIAEQLEVCKRRALASKVKKTYRQYAARLDDGSSRGWAPDPLPGKTKISTNLKDSNGGHAMAAGRKIDILPYSAATEYLGRMLALDSLHDSEVTHRLQKGWSIFCMFLDELKLF